MARLPANAPNGTVKTIHIKATANHKGYPAYYKMMKGKWVRIVNPNLRAARAKFNKYYKGNPAGKAQDLAHTSKHRFSKNVGKYQPGRNDFIGLDTRRGIQKPSVKKRATGGSKKRAPAKKSASAPRKVSMSTARRATASKSKKRPFALDPERPSAPKRARKAPAAKKGGFALDPERPGAPAGGAAPSVVASIARAPGGMDRS